MGPWDLALLIFLENQPRASLKKAFPEAIARLVAEGEDVASQARFLATSLGIDHREFGLLPADPMDEAYRKVRYELERHPSDSERIAAAFTELRRLQSAEADAMAAAFRQRNAFDPDATRDVLVRVRNLLSDA